MKILVADDDPVNLEIIRVYLEEMDYTLVYAEDGQQVLEQLTIHPDIELLLLDWMMPKLSGPEICERLSQVDRFYYIIIITALDGAEKTAQALEAGANDFISKPFKQIELRARLRVGHRMLTLQRQMVQSQKIESIGRLATGLAHEINTPIQYLSNNTQFLEQSFTDLNLLCDDILSLLKLDTGSEQLTECIEKIWRTVTEIDLSYLRQEIPEVIQRSLEGVDHIADIVKSMHGFAHPGVSHKTQININETIRNTLQISSHKWKEKTEVHLDLEKDLPLVPCLAVEINQVLLNLIINAVDAVEQMQQNNPGEQGILYISTRHNDQLVEIRIIDNGIGIAPEIKDKVFEPFFTTKDIGKGSGQGLSTAYSIIVKNHNGSLDFKSTVGEGTTFIVQLPTNGLKLPMNVGGMYNQFVC